jgi:hypothetical protein
MPFTPWDWENAPNQTTPLSATNLEAMQTHVAEYADTVAAGGIELGYAEITTTFQQTGAGNSDITGLSVTVDVGDRPIVIKANGTFGSSSAGAVTYVKIMEGSTVLARAIISLSAVAQGLSREVRLTPSAGSHTYKLNLEQVVGGNGSVFADTGTAYGPASIQVIEV